MSRFHEMGWSERLERFRWYVTNPLNIVARSILIGLYFLPAVALRIFGVRFLTSDVKQPNFGHLAHELQFYIAGEMLGVHPRYHAVYLAPPWHVANQSLLNYWRDRVIVVGNPLLAVLLMPFRWERVVTYPIYTVAATVKNDRGEALTAGAAMDEIGVQFDAKFDGRPIVSITPEHQKRGLEQLKQLGMPEGAWWVCLHIREGSFRTRSVYMNSFRDVDPMSYMDAVQAVVERGGWVVRTGDPSMTPLPEMGQLIDYVHSDARADWMDVFLIGSCRFMLGSDSGPMAVAPMFGRPVAATNMAPMGHGAHGLNDLHIPKLYRSERENRLLRFDEVLLTDARDWGRTDQFESDGVRWVDNTPEEIRALAVEMMDRLDGSLDYSPDEEYTQTNYKGLLRRGLTASTYGTNSRIGRDFLRAHMDLLRTE